MRDIWGSSPKDVYVVGHNDQPGPETMFHFDGRNWRTTGFHVAEGGSVQRPVSLSGIYGFATNDIWAVGEHIYSNPTPPPNFLDSSLAIHFDGVRWLEHKLQGGRALRTVWGNSPTEVWAGGLAGTLYHYNGTIWKKTISSPQINFASVGGISSSEVYALGYRQDVAPYDTTTIVIYRFQPDKWTRIDSALIIGSGSIEAFGAAGIWSIDGKVYSYGKGFYRREGERWIKEFDFGLGVFRVGGSGRKNIFATGLGEVFHFNGTDWQRLTGIPQITSPLTGVWTDGKECFIVGNDGRKTYILHGK
jgi:hypothetical protein